MTIAAIDQSRHIPEGSPEGPGGRNHSCKGVGYGRLDASLTIIPLNVVRRSLSYEIFERQAFERHLRPWTLSLANQTCSDADILTSDELCGYAAEIVWMSVRVDEEGWVKGVPDMVVGGPILTRGTFRIIASAKQLLPSRELSPR